ncbi:hypothetical protein EDC17_100832 [Sphingobacterium alimentarium]|uniref:Uncharacterized protein n=1 Tax=Sphingobacterium alimentarium TaxID=797292 RepID=A0A4R3VYH6_9SPHI|nr:hypothetical protein [Sphingobacterium alimentarium]TCV18783.1 hypothetical protein EDC17_100832 [Sphingobacterium alimentarium]
MNKLILVESIELGNLVIQGFIVDKGNNVLSYSIFVSGFEEPLIDMSVDVEKNVHISVNKNAAQYINSKKTQDKKKRKEYFKQFYKYILESEKRASYMVFKKQKLNYIRNSADLLEIKKMYISD